MKRFLQIIAKFSKKSVWPALGRVLINNFSQLAKLLICGSNESRFSSAHACHNQPSALKNLEQGLISNEQVFTTYFEQMLQTRANLPLMSDRGFCLFWLNRKFGEVLSNEMWRIHRCANSKLQAWLEYR